MDKLWLGLTYFYMALSFVLGVMVGAYFL